MLSAEAKTRVHDQENWGEIELLELALAIAMGESYRPDPGIVRRGSGPSHPGPGTFLEQLRPLLRSPPSAATPTRRRIDASIAAIDQLIGRHLDQILHHPDFQRLEAAWRGLKFTVDHTDFSQNIEICVLSAHKEELYEDFLENPEIAYSGLYHHVYEAEYGQHGGRPYAAIIGDFYFGAGLEDTSLLRNICAVAAIAHAPFIAAVQPAFLGLESFEGLDGVRDLEAIFAQPQYTAWRAFRKSEETRYLGLTLPRFLLRRIYGREASVAYDFPYEEDVSEGAGQFVWGNAAFALATCLTRSFARYGWCPNIIGREGGGLVEGMAVSSYDVSMRLPISKMTTEVLISETLETSLSELGLIPLCALRGEGRACFYSASSVQRARRSRDERLSSSVELNYELGRQLPYLLIISRLAHYVKLIQRENLGSDKDKRQLVSELRTWIRDYVSEQDVAQAGVRMRKPLREANFAIEDVPGEAGWYKITMNVVPHFKYLGSFFSLSVVGRLDGKGE